MHHRSLRFVFALVAAFAFSGAWAQGPVERAGQVLDQLEAGQFEEVAAGFSPQMAAQVDAATLRQGWTSIAAQAGALQSRGEPVEHHQDGQHMVVTPLHYENGVINAIVAFDHDDKVSGLLFQPAQPAPAAAEPTAEPAAEPTDEP